MVQEDKAKYAKKKQNTVNIKNIISVICRSPLKYVRMQWSAHHALSISLIFCSRSAISSFRRVMRRSIS